MNILHSHCRIWGGDNEMIKQYSQLLLMRVVREVPLLPISMAKLDEFIVGTKQFLNSVLLVGD